MEGNMKGKNLKKISLAKCVPVPPTQPEAIEGVCQKISVTIGNQTFDCEAKDLTHRRYLGHGSQGVVEEMEHCPTKTVLAVKKMMLTQDSTERAQILMDLETNMRSGSCPQTVKCHGALFEEGHVMIVMEAMNASLSHLKKMLTAKNERIPENVLGKMALSVVLALHYLHSELQVIHQDVKPANILIDLKGEVKMCDFGVSGRLTDSKASTRIGSRLYMAPEKINPLADQNMGHSVKSDVWSLGITLIELATKFPYSSWPTPFEHIKQVVEEEPPRLPASQFSSQFEEFIVRCLQKDPNARADYKELLDHPFLQQALSAEVDMAGYITSVIDRHGPLNPEGSH